MDKDLMFLKELDNESLQVFAQHVIFDKQGDYRFKQHMQVDKHWEDNYPNNMIELLPRIEKNYRLYGGNSVANAMLRFGEGPTYSEILCDVCDKLKIDNVSWTKKMSVEYNERALLEWLLEKALTELTEEQLKDIAKEIKIPGVEKVSASIVLAAIKSQGFVPYQVLVTIVNMVAKAALGKGLPLAANAALTKSLAVALGPVMWVISGSWLVLDLAGPATRVTIPTTIIVTILRASQKEKVLI